MPQNERLTRLLIATLALSIAAGCSPDVTYGDQAGPAWSVLSGQALAQELSISPVRRPEQPFVRLGVLWEGPLGANVEISTSVDGKTWSSWQRPTVSGVEAENSASFVGQIIVQGEPAQYYRVQSATVMPSFVRLSPLYYAAGLVESGQAPPVVDRATAAASFMVGSVQVNSRVSWNARAPMCVSSHTPAAITFHHTATPNNDTISGAARVRQIQNYHQNTKGWCDIGYHFLITRDGQVWEGRPATRIGAHISGYNSNNIGIGLVGNFNEAPPTNQQIDASVALIAGLNKQYGIQLTVEAVKTHKDYTPAGCIGQTGSFTMATLLSRAAGGSVNPGQPPSFPQGDKAVLRGKIYERGNQNFGLAGVTVTIDGTGLTATTDGNGMYIIHDVPKGYHLIKVTHSRYQEVSMHRYIGPPEQWGSMGLVPLSNSSTTPPTGNGPSNSGLPAQVERWRPLVEKYFHAEHVTWALHIIDCESDGDPNARNSNGGASGLFQHLPQYWAERAANSGFAGASPFEAEANIAASAYLLYRAPGAGPHHWVCTYAPYEDWNYRPGSTNNNSGGYNNNNQPSQPSQQSQACHIGQLFDFAYCSANCPCGRGQGDCDTDAECQPGLRCVQNVGAKYGLASYIDICE